MAYKRLVVFLVTVLSVNAVHASFETVIAIAQPLQLGAGESGVRITTVPYVGHMTTDPVRVVMLTVAPNQVPCGNRAENRNMAGQIGIQFDHVVEPEPDAVWRPPVPGDTLQIRVDLSKMGTPLNESQDDLVSATLWCGLQNARLWPAVWFVEYTITGNPLFDTYTGVYALAGLDPICGVLRWSTAEKQALIARCKRRTPVENRD